MNIWDLGYNEHFNFALNNPEKFWDVIAKDVVWSKPYTSVLEDKDSFCPRWFVGGELNMSYNCLDKQVEDGYGEDVAVIHDSAITGTIQKLTYKELLESVELLSGVMVKKCRVTKGDKALLYFPMIPQCLIAMLACTRIGVISTTVYGGFATKELAARIRYFEPKLIICSNVGLEPGLIINYKDRIDNAIILSKFAPDHCIIYNRPNYDKASLKEGRDFDWNSEIKIATPQGSISLESDHPQYVIFTSGTTGEPKGIVRPTGGSTVVNIYCMRYSFDLKPGDVWWAMSEFGWVVGQTFIGFAPLMSRNPTIIFEGKLVGTPNEAQFRRVLNEHKVVSFVSAPTVLKILRQFCSKSDIESTYKYLRSIHLGGECTDESISEWTSKTFGCAVYNIWGQTELGFAGISASIGLKDYMNFICKSDMGLVMPGIDCRILDRVTGEEVPRETVGRMVFKRPLPPSAFSTLYKDHERYIRTYFCKYPGYYDTMDAGLITKDGFVKVLSRDDDIIHVGAVRICGGAVEEACLRNEFISEVAVVALKDELKGFVPFAFLLLKRDCPCSDKDVINQIKEIVLNDIGEVACFEFAIIVPTLPKTKSGKTPRQFLASMLNGKECTIPSTIENPEAFSIIYEILLKNGYKPSIPNPS